MDEPQLCNFSRSIVEISWHEKDLNLGLLPVYIPGVHSFSGYAKLTCAYQGMRNVSFSENLLYKLDE